LAQFRAIIQGQRGEASRLGGKKTGISAEVNGWNSGISVRGYFDSELGKDVFVVTLNNGNGYNAGKSKVIGRFTEDDLLTEKLSPVNWVEVDDLAQDIENAESDYISESTNYTELSKNPPNLAAKMKELVRRAASAGITPQE